MCFTTLEQSLKNENFLSSYQLLKMQRNVFRLWWSIQPVALAIDALVLPTPCTASSLNGFAINPQVATFSPKWSWCLDSVNLRCLFQICSNTIQTAIPPNLLSCCPLVIRFPDTPYSISFEFALTINEGNDFYIIARAHGVNPICFYLPRFRIRDPHSCDFIAENLLCCRM